MEALYREELQPAGVQVVGVSQFNTTESETAAFVARHELSFPNFYDANASLARAYGVQGVPTYVFLDKEGRVAHRSAGARGVALIQSRLNDLLRE